MTLSSPLTSHLSNIPCPCLVPQRTPTQVIPCPSSLIPSPERSVSRWKALTTQLLRNHQQRQIHKAASTQTPRYKRGGRSPVVRVPMLVGIYGAVEATTCFWKGEGGLALGVAAVLFTTIVGLWGSRCGAGALRELGGESASPGRSKPSSAQLLQRLFHSIKRRDMHPIYSSCYMQEGGHKPS